MSDVFAWVENPSYELTPLSSFPLYLFFFSSFILSFCFPFPWALYRLVLYKYIYITFLKKYV
jgi:hypothetical protein